MNYYLLLMVTVYCLIVVPIGSDILFAGSFLTVVNRSGSFILRKTVYSTKISAC